MSDYGTVCQSCGGREFAATRHRNVFGLGADLIECAACGVRCYDRPAAITPEAFYAGPRYDAYVGRDVAGGSPLNPDPAKRRRYEHAAAGVYRRALALGRTLAGEPFAALYEVGCGVGRLLAEARAMGVAATYGCDVNAENVAHARAGGADVFAGFLCDAPGPPAPVDAVAMFDVIEHTATPGADLRRALDLTRVGGVLIVQSFYDEWHDDLPALDLSAARHGDRSMQTTGYFCPVSHPHHFTRAALRGAVSRAGWHVVMDRIAPESGIVTLHAVRPAAP